MDKMIRIDEVLHRTGLSRSTVYAKKDKKSRSYDPNFPAPVKLGPRASAWSENILQAWIEGQQNGRTIEINDAAAKPKSPKKRATPEKGKAVNQHAIYDWTNVKKIVTGEGKAVHESDYPTPKIPPGLSSSSE